MKKEIDRIEPIFGTGDMQSRSVGEVGNILVDSHMRSASSPDYGPMTPQLQKASGNRVGGRKRTHTRGVAVAMLIKWIGVFLVAYAAAELTNYFSEARGVANPLKSGPFPVYSFGWYMSQVAAAFVGALAGYVCAYFSPPGTWRAPIILAAIYLGLGIVSTPAAGNLLLSAYWILVSPISIMAGALAFKSLDRTNGA